MAYKITKEKIVKEVVKSGKKPVYFINTYCKIPHPGKGLIPFKTYDFQADLVEDLALHRFIVVLKARQLGFLQLPLLMLLGWFYFTEIRTFLLLLQN